MVPASLVPSLAREAYQAIDLVFQNGVPALSMGPPKSEPAFVAAFVLGAVANIVARWRSHFRPLGLRIRATCVFVRGAPRVSFTGVEAAPSRYQLS